MCACCVVCAVLRLTAVVCPLIYRRVSDFYPITGCIVFVLDASDSPMLRKAAEYVLRIAFCHHAQTTRVACENTHLQYTRD